MNSDRPHLTTQIPLLSRLQSNCRQYQQVCLQIHDQLQQLTEAGVQARQQLLRDHQSSQRMLDERIAAEFRSRTEQILNAEITQRECIEKEQRQQLAELKSVYEDLKLRRQKVLDDELWVLQSVCDENGEDTPVSQYERADSVFENQQKEILRSLNDLNQRMDETAAYLSRCHAGTDTLLPTPSIKLGTSDQNRQSITDQSAEALKLSDQIFQMHLPQWVCGWRAFGLSLILFVILAVPIAAVKADLHSFLNPGIGTPNWEWLGVSCLISGAAVVLVITVLMLLVQQKLRSRFQQMQQSAANVQFATSGWNAQSVKELHKLKVTAEKWHRQITKVREQQTELLREGADSQIGSMQHQYEANVAAVRQHHQARLESIHQRQQNDMAAMIGWRQSETDRLKLQMQTEMNAHREQLERNLSEQSTALERHRKQILERWRNEAALATSIGASSREFVASTQHWPQLTEGRWTPPEDLPLAIPVGQIGLTIPDPPNSDHADFDLAAEVQNSSISMPAVLSFPADTSLVIEHNSAGRETALEFVRAMLLKLLTTIPPGRVQFTLADPVGLGQSFSALMHLADFDELIIGHRIWTESVPLRDRLQKVTEHMENVFQTYLRSQFETIEQYNASAGEVAEPYHFVVIADFPTAFSEEAARYLSSIISSGPRCGVHVIMTTSPKAVLPRMFDPAILQNHCLRFRVDSGCVVPVTDEPLTVEFSAMKALPTADYVEMVRAVGEKSKDARRVEVSFTRIAPQADQIWTGSTASGINLPIGRAGATRLQHLRLGGGTSQHVLIAGKTGSGKSTLLHILITNLALHYSPDEIQFFLIDFKKGVEFQTYVTHQLPHARVVAIESDREFGLSVLERLDEILQERGELFRSRGVQDVPAFRERCQGEALPRILLLIDEFQEFFVAEDRVSSRAALLLDRLVRQGRAFGIHVILGSQTLGGAYSLARSTLGQIAVRVALQCSESDAHLILSEENSAARTLVRPGEAIYNDANGLAEGNHPFQIAWLNDRRREQALQDVLNHQRRMGTPQKVLPENRMIVFEGTVPPSADHCGPLNVWLRSETDATRRVSEFLPIWIGEPVAIAPPTCVELRRASGQNLLIVGQDADMADGILLMAALSCFHPAVSADEATVPQFLLLHDQRDHEAVARFRAAFAGAIPDRFISRSSSETSEVIDHLHQQLLVREATIEKGEQPELLLTIRNIGQFRSLRRDDDEFSFGSYGEAKTATPATQLSEIIKRGPLVGIHVIVWSDSFSNAMRWLSTSMLREFENRIAFRMNQTDSASLVDTPVASSLAPGRAILYRDQTGNAEKFRPFAWPTAEWLARALPTPKIEMREYDEFDIDSFVIE